MPIPDPPDGMPTGCVEYWNEYWTYKNSHGGEDPPPSWWEGMPTQCESYFEQTEPPDPEG